jgi:hypothetical protein
MGRFVATYTMMSAARLSSSPTCWNRTYIGMATAIGGRMRWEISQKAMSLFARAQRKRRPMAWARMANTATDEAIPTGSGAPRATISRVSATHPTNRPMIPNRG